MIKELRMAMFTWLLRLIIGLVPKEATKTLNWLKDMPWEVL